MTRKTNDFHLPPLAKKKSRGMCLWGTAAKSLLVSSDDEKGIEKFDMASLSEVLMRSFHKEWERKTQFMKDCILFKDWMHKEVRAAGSTSTISEYLNNKVIVKDLSTHRGTVFVVMSGTCLVVSKIDVIKESLPYGKESLRMVAHENIDKIELTRYQRKDEIFLVIRKLRHGDCFGIGEQLPQTSVISEHKVEVLAVPTIHILRHGRGQSLERIQGAEMTKYPTLKSAFRNYLSHREWNLFKQTIRETVTQNKQTKRQAFRTFADRSLNDHPNDEPA